MLSNVRFLNRNTACTDIGFLANLLSHSQASCLFVPVVVFSSFVSNQDRVLFWCSIWLHVSSQNRSVRAGWSRRSSFDRAVPSATPTVSRTGGAGTMLCHVHTGFVMRDTGTWPVHSRVYIGFIVRDTGMWVVYSRVYIGFVVHDTGTWFVYSRVYIGFVVPVTQVRGLYLVIFILGLSCRWHRYVVCT